jgi:hypothetical protein
VIFRLADYGAGGSVPIKQELKIFRILAGDSVPGFSPINSAISKFHRLASMRG